jgi:phage gp37-like protein
MLTMGKEIKLTARYSEFLTDALSAVDSSNAHLDGDNDTIAASPAVWLGYRVSNDNLISVAA